MIAFNDKFHLTSDVRCSDKSLTHRALIVAAIADGVSHIDNISVSRDILATIEALRALGAVIELNGNRATVTPIRAVPSEEVSVFCGGSGTTARLIAGLTAGIGAKARFFGDASLSARPMQRVVEPLRALGADIVFERGCLFVCRGGSLRGGDWQARVNSAQVKSAVVLAGLFAEGTTRYEEKMPTRDHTEIMLDALGADVHTDGGAVVVRKSRPRSFDTVLPNDPSAVAYSVALALLKGKQAVFVDVLLNPTRLGFYDVLKRSGADISFTHLRTVMGERIGDITVNGGTLSPFDVSEEEVVRGIDEVPLLAAMSFFVKGKHTFRGVAELAHKECNRIDAVIRLAAICRQSASFDGADLTVTSCGNVPRGRRFPTFGDHRIAMCGTVLSVASGCGCIDDAPFDVSHPDFLSALGISPLRLGLIGSCAESVSPRLQTYLAMQAGVCCSYVTVTLNENASDAELSQIIDRFDGLNVTMPFKTRVAKLLHADVPSVNTVGKGISPCSTDGYGLIHSLMRRGVRFADSPLWIVGAGGAAEACIRELLGYGCKLQILNRTAANARALRDKYDLPERVADPVGVLTFIPECDFEKSLILPDSCRFVFIAAYKGYSNIRAQARSRGIAVVDGLEMNYAQGAASFSLWTGTPVQDDYEGYLQYVGEFDYI